MRDEKEGKRRKEEIRRGLQIAGEWRKLLAFLFLLFQNKVYPKFPKLALKINAIVDPPPLSTAIMVTFISPLTHPHLPSVPRRFHSRPSSPPLSNCVSVIVTAARFCSTRTAWDLLLLQSVCLSPHPSTLPLSRPTSIYPASPLLVPSLESLLSLCGGLSKR